MHLTYLSEYLPKLTISWLEAQVKRSQDFEIAKTCGTGTGSTLKPKN